MDRLVLALAIAIACGCGRIGFGEQHAGDARDQDPDAEICPAGESPVVQVSAGRGFTCARRADGTVACWGTNGFGELGPWATSPVHLDPVEVPLPGPVRWLASGNAHSCAVLEDGRVLCWGSDGSGQLGRGAGGAAPWIAAAMPPAAEVVAGSSFSCARTAADGTVYCWGSNQFGQLGDGTSSDTSTPVPVALAPGAHGLAAGHLFACAIAADRGVACWGAGERTPVAVANLSGVTQLAAGARFACALRGDGTATCWGGNASGELGTGEGGTYRPVPGPELPLPPIASLAAGRGYACARLADGTVRCWGDNSVGQLGDGTQLARRAPAEPVLGLASVTAIAAGHHHACSVARGIVRCWGSAVNGELGDGVRALEPRPVPVTATAIADGIVAGGDARVHRQHALACAWRAGGATCWGSAPTAGAVFADVAQLALGQGHACAREPGGTVRCAGANWTGQLGDGSTASSATPVLVPDIAGATDVAAGGFSTCAVDGGAVRCWGANDAGQLGDGTTTTRLAPVTAGAFTDAVQVRTNGATTCARLAGGAVHCWGWNYNGQLGDGTVTSRTTPGPVDLTGAGAADALELGGGHACVTASGTPWCWGSNAKLQLGHADFQARLLPSEVPGVSGAVALALGAEHTCALDDQQQVWCWGRNDVGQLGDGTVGAPRATPARVIDLEPAVAIAAAGRFTCALVAGGALRCWGDDANGQLGRGAYGVTPRRARVYCSSGGSM